MYIIHFIIYCTYEWHEHKRSSCEEEGEQHEEWGKGGWEDSGDEYEQSTVIYMLKSHKRKARPQRRNLGYWKIKGEVALQLEKCVCVCACISVCTGVCMCVGMYVCVCVHICGSGCVGMCLYVPS